ncbi:glycosyltransferase family 4 protein [Vibrio algarum]|uniref:Glycosyltransferase family 4 protein n=1 Tax=Vibrio algarum TaxID=3020714 RepID=A0ABT4YQ97_9VIBR|nr:glycosyltransferase family 4 protein [Vibrio sp. KJ40-1]MDB1123721.1 glycosyltransferase family 4 protein [Vibrio sp. KJ40-1]
MKILTVSTLFPYENNPKHGIFIETRLRHLREHYPDVEAKVIAPIPYFPSSHPVFGSYAENAKAPHYEKRHDIDVFHPRYLVVPKIGMTLTPETLANSIYKQALQMIADGYDFDLIDGHYFYPDGVAIAKVARKLNKPFTVTARGTDINLIPKFVKPKKQIQQVLKQSDHNMAVCEALRKEMITLGAEPNKVTTLRNGVDLDLFSFIDEQKKQVLKDKFNLPKETPVIISVGHLIERKGHHLVIEALKQVPNTLLLIAGDGPEKKSLQRLTDRIGVKDRVRFLGSLSQIELSQYYGASDLLVLASSREGWANVLLEAMACGTPVVATNIWGTPEVVTTKEAGQLVERDSSNIAAGVLSVLNNLPERQKTRHYAENFDWLSTSTKQYELFNKIIKGQ